MQKPIRPIRIEGNLAFITLTQGYEAVIDAADVGLINDRNWHAAVQKGGVVYARAAQPREGRKIKEHIVIHRVIMGNPLFMVDHRDGDGLNNRRKNLREATRAQNGMNRRVPCNNASGFKGVHWCNTREKWAAHIRFLGRSKHLGYFGSVEEAAAAYREGSIKYHGEFGRAG